MVASYLPCKLNNRDLFRGAIELFKEKKKKKKNNHYANGKSRYEKTMEALDRFDPERRLI